MYKACLSLLVVLAFSTPAPAQDLRETEAVCADETATSDMRIAACSRLINDAVYTDLADYAATHLRRAAAYRSGDNPTAAIADIDIALDYDPYLYAGYMARGDLLLETGEVYRAISDFTVAGGLNPLEAAPYTKRGLALFANREYGEAIASLETALGYDKGDMEASRTLAWILATAPDRSLRNGARAMEVIQPLNEPGIGVQDQIILAAAKAEAGQTDDAIGTYQQIINAEPGAALRFKQYLAANDYYDGVMDSTFSPDLAAALRQCLEAGCRIGAPRR